MSDYTKQELTEIEDLRNSCIIELFETTDKRWVLEKYLKFAFNLGRAKREIPVELCHCGNRKDIAHDCDPENGGCPLNCEEEI